MTVTRRKDTKTPRVFMHKIADVRGGVSVNVSELTQDYLPEGTILSVPVSGVSHVIKTAILQADVTNSATDYKVLKGHNFKVGDVIMLATSAKAYAITAITTVITILSVWLRRCTAAICSTSSCMLFSSVLLSMAWPPCVFLYYYSITAGRRLPEVFR